MLIKCCTNSITCEDLNFLPLSVHIIEGRKGSSWIFILISKCSKYYLYHVGNYRELTGARRYTNPSTV